MTTPCMLNKVINEIGCGAMLKHIESDKKAIIVDFTSQGAPLVCSYHGDNGSKEPTFYPEDYMIHVIDNSKEWIVLNMGQNEYILVD